MPLQGVPTSLGYAKCDVLKLRKVCERSELCLQNIDPIKRGELRILSQRKGENFEFCPDKKGEILNFDPVTSLKLLFFPFLLGLFVNVARFARKLF